MSENPFEMMQGWFEQLILNAVDKVIDDRKRENSIELLTAEEVAEALRLDVKAVYKLDLVRIKPYGEGSKAVRFSKYDVARYIQENTEKTKIVQIGRVQKTGFWDKKKVA